MENTFGEKVRGEEGMSPNIGRGNTSDSNLASGLRDNILKQYSRKIRRFYQRRILALLENIRHSLDIQRRSFWH